jgi:hypothetical protein
MRLERRFSVFVAGLLCSSIVNLARASETPPTEATTVEVEPRPARSMADSRLTEIVYLNVETGAEYVGLESLHLSEELIPSTARTWGIGPAFGVGAGVRFVFIELGPRFRYATLPDFDLWSLGGELGLRVPLGPFEPWLSLGAGFAKVGRLRDRRVRVSGYDVRLGLGLDYYFSKNWSLGAAASGEVLGLTRPGVNLNESSGSVSDDVLKLDGSSVGLAVMGGLVFGAHL